MTTTATTSTWTRRTRRTTATGRGWTKVWDDPTPGYATGHDGFLVVAHRTWRVSPAGWVWAVREGRCANIAPTAKDMATAVSGAHQYAYGYSPTRERAYRDALAWLDSEAGEQALRTASEAHGPVDYYGHDCVADDGSDYGTEPHWWTFVEHGYVSAPTLRELHTAIECSYQSEASAR